MQSAERAAALTRQLLAFSRKEIVAPRDLDLNALLVNLSKGGLGGPDCRLLGMMLTRYLFNAALSRADVPRPARVPFYFYLDEFQNFVATDIAARGIDQTEGHDSDKAGQDEKHTSDQAALGLMKKPADIDGELLCFRPRKEHAEVQSMQKSVLTDPLLFLDKDAMHQRDLTGRSAEGKKSDPSPYPHCFGKRNAVRWSRCAFMQMERLGGRGIGHDTLSHVTSYPL